MGIFLTDGQNDDEGETELVLRESQNKPIYWALVGVGDPEHFEFLSRMADKYPNVGFVNFSSLSITDEQLFDRLITEELCTFVKKFE